MGLCQAHEACLEAPLLKVITKIGKGQLLFIRLFNVIILHVALFTFGYK